MKVAHFVVLTILCGAVSCNSHGIPANPHSIAPEPTPRSFPPVPLLLDAIVDHQDQLAMKLIAEGADVESHDEHGSTSLWFAASRLNPSITIVRALVERGANVNARCIGGATPLHGACEGESPEVVQYLISHGAKIQAKDGDGSTPMDYARDYAEFNEPDRCAEVMKILDAAIAASKG